MGSETDRAIVCARCDHELTSSSAACDIDGLHRYTQVNPGGHIWNFRCFRRAPGVFPVGRPSTEFTWFAGCVWQVGHCQGCDLHVGWLFSEAQVFVALIVERIASRG